jgi:hypothetical protein
LTKFLGWKHLIEIHEKYKKNAQRPKGFVQLLTVVTTMATSGSGGGDSVVLVTVRSYHHPSPDMP